jgi:SAM-dependent methyltransferase
MQYKINDDGIYRSSFLVHHRDDEYDQATFKDLWAMQEKHFWYQGRHRFLLAACDRFRRNVGESWSAVDLGGGVGGWISYLEKRRAAQFSSLALADSSEIALQMAANALPASIDRYQIDLMNLGWESKWDCIFLLDVIEHLPDDAEAMREAAKALKPGGYLFVTTPALAKFWSYNDELVHHLRRYNRSDYAHLAELTGLELCDSRYFMFFLSPLYWLSRRGESIEGMSKELKAALIEKTHRVPSAPINGVLSAIFSAETPLGHFLNFPWGTSILGVFRKV